MKDAINDYAARVNKNKEEKKMELDYNTIHGHAESDAEGYDFLVVWGKDAEDKDYSIQVPIESVWKALGLRLMGGKKLDALCK